MLFVKKLKYKNSLQITINVIMKRGFAECYEMKANRPSQHRFCHTSTLSLLF